MKCVYLNYLNSLPIGGVPIEALIFDIFISLPHFKAHKLHLFHINGIASHIHIHIRHLGPGGCACYPSGPGGPGGAAKNRTLVVLVI